MSYARQEGVDWRPLVESQLQTLGKKNDASKRLDNKGKDFKVMKQVASRFPESLKDQMANWCRITGKSRASFYRAMKNFNENQ